MSLRLLPRRLQSSSFSTLSHSSPSSPSSVLLRPITTTRSSTSSSLTPISSKNINNNNLTRSFSSTTQKMSSHNSGVESASRKPFDAPLTALASYIHSYTFKDPSPQAWEAARYTLFDALGCGLEALKYEECRKLLGPVVDGTVVPNGCKIPGTPYVLDPIRGAFNVGTMVRWLDFNDTFLAAEWGHPSDNLGAIWAVADHVSRSNPSNPLTVKHLLLSLIHSHELQGSLSLLNSFNSVGLDHVLLVKLASAASTSKLLGQTEEQTRDVLSHVFVDGASLRTYRHAPNAGPRKSWAAGDAGMKAVGLAWNVGRGQIGLPTVLSTKGWGFYDVCFKGQEIKFERPLGCYIMENVLFKISFPAEFHAQTAAEAALLLHKQLKDQGKSAEDIKHVKIRTQSAAMRILNKSGPLHNYADRDHCMQYMVAIPLLYGRLEAGDYTDEVAKDPKIDELRAKMDLTEDTQFSSDYLDPDRRYIPNAITITLNDGTVLDELEIKFPVGHKNRREEGKPLLLEKFKRHVTPHYPKEISETLISLMEDPETLEKMDVPTFVDLWHKP